MKIQYLGTAAAEGVPALFCECENCTRSRALGGRNIRSRSQALVDETILIDFPADTYMHFLLHSLPMHRLHTCLITHSHSDHLYPADLEMRRDFLAHLSDKATPMTFYSDRSGFDLITQEIRRHDLRENEILCRLVIPFVPFPAEGYTITPLRANHDPASSPVLYILEKDGKSLFYSNDTGEYPEETWEYLKNRRSPLSLISLDCTEACRHSDFPGHLDLWRCLEVRKRLLADGAADENTIFVLNHFSHNGIGSVYEDFSKVAAEYGFLVSYDGMTVEF